MKENILLETEFINFIQRHALFGPGHHLLLAVSGGVDSMVLCRLCDKMGFQFSIAHCNFGLRGQESNRDELLVQSLAQQLNVTYYVQHFETAQYALAHKISIQVAARELRYNWFFQIIEGKVQPSIGPQKDIPPQWILTAHHADDNVETIVMNFFKGTGINGLKGIASKQQNIIRPLLFASKNKLLAYAQANNIAFVTDSSNNSDKYTRNYFRNQVLPLIEKAYPAAMENLLQNAERFKDIHCIYQSAIHQIKKQLLEHRGAEVHIPVLKLQKTDALSTVVFEIMKEYGFTAHQTGDVIKLLQAESGKYVLSATHGILRNRKWLIIYPLSKAELSQYIIDAGTSEIDFAAGKIKLATKAAPMDIDSNPKVAQLDASAIQYPLLLRRWKTGDYFYPLGMAKKKKISRFLIDQKLSKIQKANTWVIESNKKIVWVAGMRIDNRFKLTGSSTDILLLHLVLPGQTN